MKSEIYSFPREKGEIQRVQLVRPESWQSLDFFAPTPSPEALHCFADIYEKYLIPACPPLFCNMVLFLLPQELNTQLPDLKGKSSQLCDKLSIAAAALQKGIRIQGGAVHFKDESLRPLWKELESRGCIRIIKGMQPRTKIIPVGNIAGYLSRSVTEASMKVNSSFFIMDCFDAATIHDHVGTPLGLCIKDGEILNPPLFAREALLVRKDGSVSIEQPRLEDLSIKIGKYSFKHGENCRIYSRPERLRSPMKGEKLVIVGERVVAVTKGTVKLPASGFVLCPFEKGAVKVGEKVRYGGMEDVAFGTQVGNSILRDGVVTDRFISRFYNLRHLEPVPFPPSLYPMDFSNSRAARIALGADEKGAPMLLWAEGAAKSGHIPGEDSCGASLSEMAEICKALGMHNAVNLDGGGSAQILLNNLRSLKISDRQGPEHAEAERPVALGLCVK